MPLALGMVEPQHRPGVLENLVADIRGNENHITAGDIGFRYVLTALAEAGRSDVIHDLLVRTDPPSYGYQLVRGATTLTEAWDANPKRSQNHLMLGHAESWFYEWLCGIQLDLTQPAGRQIVLRPTPVADVTWAAATYDSALGRIESRWELSGRKLKLSVEIPPSAGADTVYVPARDAGSVKVIDGGGTGPIGRARCVGNENVFALYEVTAGFCAFESDL
jgi:hypothetical protein